MPGRMNSFMGNSVSAARVAAATSGKAGASKSCLRRKNCGNTAFTGSVEASSSWPQTLADHSPTQFARARPTQVLVDSFPIQLRQKSKALWNLRFARRRFVFDEIPFHADLLRRAQGRDEINLAGAQCNVVGHVRMAGEQACRGALFHVLQMHQRPARTVFLQELRRVLSGVDNPKNVH